MQVARLRKWICGNYTVKGKSGDLKLRVDASIGLAACQGAEGMNELIARADATMYEQKSASSKQRSDTKRPAAEAKIRYREGTE